jgi:hypothetical protein
MSNHVKDGLMKKKRGMEGPQQVRWQGVMPRFLTATAPRTFLQGPSHRFGGGRVYLHRAVLQTDSARRSSATGTQASQSIAMLGRDWGCCAATECHLVAGQLLVEKHLGWV